ncbi:hypothetical protein L9F63_004068 [Diploptera punctata]|uniref:Uncharacterized protein n=1 Tax=Diploptera punctata TaxID=6984 RepID=A0AAD8E7L5_DIPPU|nr:hypothetical protein L9F63_004068 [Diploptera punctata]
MNICASNGIRSENILDSVESSKLDQNLVAIAKGERKIKGEVFVSSKNSQSAPVKSVAAAPRMPQQSAPRNTTQEEAAGVPSSVTAPTFVIPPHLMGRNVNNPAEDMIGSGRKLQKPRLGVRVPYRNLTSQIVTQDEIAQELLERSMKKHPVHDTPEGGDFFFAMKLTQRLANRLSPSTTVSTNISGNEIESIAGRSGHFQQNSDNNCLLPSSYTLVPETTAIPDDRELLAILEGEADTEWIPNSNPPILEGAIKTSIADITKPPVLVEAASVLEQVVVHSTPPKLDPSVERAMALKQLMELPRRIKVQINSQDSENNNKASVNGSSKVETDSSNKQKQARKRKLPDPEEGNAKKPKMSRKKKAELSNEHSSTYSNNKTDENSKKPKVARIQKKSAVVPKHQEVVGVTTINGSSASGKRRKGITNCVETAVSERTDLNKSPVPSTSGVNTQELSKTDKDSDDEFSQSMLLHSKKTGTPPKNL